jgi:hypothetical protein
MPMDDDLGRGQTSTGYQGQGRGSGVTDARPSPGGGNTGGRDNSDRGGGAAKEAADQKAREAAAAKSGEERRAKEAVDKTAASKAAADKVVADQKAREAAFAAARDAAIQATETANRKAAADRAAALKYMQEQAPSTGPTGRGGVAVQKGIEAVIDKATGKIITVESKGDPNAKNPNSSATGLGQFTKDTWLATVGKYRPDLMVGRTEAEVLGLRTDPAISVEMTRNLTKENAAGLQASGFPVNESTLYLSHFLGLGGAKKMLNAPADALASEVAGGDATTRNQSILGGTKTAADVLSWASKKMGGAASYDVAGVTSTTPTSTTSTSPTRGITVDAGGKEADLPAAKGTPVGASIGVGGFGRVPPAPEPTSWYDKLVSVFDSTPQIEALEDQNRLAGGLTKQEYADQFAGGDSTKVQSRIVDYGQGQQVDYYTKSLGDVFGEAASNLGKGFSDAGKGVTSFLGGETSTAMQPIVADPFVSTGFGPYGNLTREEYRKQYGGSDIATNLPPTGASTTTPPPVVPPVVPTEPVMPTVPNFAAAQQYIGTPTVATPGFNFSMPFAPRSQVDFANLGQAYAPTALASAPPPQPLPGIPGAAYATPYQRLG